MDLIGRALGFRSNYFAIGYADGFSSGEMNEGIQYKFPKFLIFSRRLKGETNRSSPNEEYIQGYDLGFEHGSSSLREGAKLGLTEEDKKITFKNYTFNTKESINKEDRNKIKSEIIECIINDETKEAIKKAILWFENNEFEKGRYVSILLLSKNTNLEKNNAKGLLDREQYNIELANIKNNLLELFKDI